MRSILLGIVATGCLVVGYQGNSYACQSITGNEEHWIAAASPDGSESFLRAGGTKKTPDSIKVGDVVSPAKPLNVRREPAGWDYKQFVLEAGCSVVITGLQKVTATSGDTQLWVMIADVKPENDTGDNAVVNENKPLDINHNAELAPTSIEDRDIYFDQYGLIVHRRPNGEFDGGDTAQREGWYWFGVWLHANVPGLTPWQPKRELTFDEVLRLLEPNHDGVFYRHPKQAPFNNPFDKEWGTSRDQLVPLIAAMGVWGKTQELRRLWDAMPEDIVGKHSFNGTWRNFLGQDGPNCSEILKRGCDAAGDCSLKVDNRECSQPHDERDCSQPHDERDCSNPLTKYVCELEKAAQNKIYESNKLACEAEKATQNGIYDMAKLKCEADKATQNAIYAGDKATCEAAKTGGKYACELDKQASYQSCRLTNIHSGDIIGPATVNLFRRAMNQDPMIPDLNNILPSTIIRSGAEGEAELFGSQHVIIKETIDNRDNVGDDLNNIVLLTMAKIRFASIVSDAALDVYRKQRGKSFGSYLDEYYKRYGNNLENLEAKVSSGAASGWPSDGRAIYGAVRWYHRPSTGANPQLAKLYQDIIAHFFPTN